MNQEQNTGREAPVQEGQRPTLKGVIQTLIVLLAGLLLFLGVNEVLRLKNGDRNIMIDPSLTKESWDVVFTGSSHANDALFPMEIWEAYGYTSYNNAQSGQILPFTYYACRSLIERYQPRVIVLDLYMLYHKRETGGTSWAHQTIDTLMLSDRIEASYHVVPEKQRKEFLLPITLYHTRWKELNLGDFTGRSASFLKGGAQKFHTADELTGISYTPQSADVKLRPPEIAIEYLDKIVALCRETGTELVLVTLPYLTSPEVSDGSHDMSRDEAYFNWAADYAAEQGLRYINYFHLVEELGIDWVAHYGDYSHMNYWGGKIVTLHLGQYLQEEFGFADHRNDPAYADWNEDLAAYHEYLQLNGVQ